MIISFRTDRSRQTVQTQIRLLLEEQSDQGLHCLQFYSPKVLVIPRNRWLRLNMTEKLFTGTLNHNKNKKNKNCLQFYSPKVLVIPRNRWLRLNMTEKLFTGTLNHNKNKKNKNCLQLHLHLFDKIHNGLASFVEF